MMTDSRTIQLGAHHRAVVSCTPGKGVVWFRLEQDGGSYLAVFTCGMSPDMAGAVAETLEHARLGASGTHRGQGVNIKVSWVNRQSDLVCVIGITSAAGGAGAAFREETGRRLAAALRWGAAAAGGMPSGADSVRSADRKRDDLMRDMFS